jgi:NAD(P)-dependent dehydrogenase (short-subunit alcohol dehydrogenase family)
MALKRCYLCTVLPLHQVPMKFMSAFTASKYALMGLTECIRAELWSQNVHVGQVHPGM